MHTTTFCVWYSLKCDCDATQGTLKIKQDFRDQDFCLKISRLVNPDRKLEGSVN
jgi:hypothetical protein